MHHIPNFLIDETDKNSRIYKQYSKRDPKYLETMKYFFPVSPHKYLHCLDLNKDQERLINDKNILTKVIQQELKIVSGNINNMRFYRDRTGDDDKIREFLSINTSFRNSEKESRKTTFHPDFKDKENLFKILNYILLIDKYYNHDEEINEKNIEEVKSYNLTDIYNNPLFNSGDKIYDRYIREIRKQPFIIGATAGFSFVFSIDNKGNFDKKIGSIHIPISYYGFKLFINIYPLKNYCLVNFKEPVFIDQTRSLDTFFIFHFSTIGFGLSMKFLELIYTILKYRYCLIRDYFKVFCPIFYFSIQLKDGDKSYNKLHCILNFDWFTKSISLHICLYFAIGTIKSSNQGLQSVYTQSIRGTATDLYNPMNKESDME